MKKLRLFCRLFFSMLKIGLFTFGGGYAMISGLEHEFVGKRGWIDGDEFADLIAIAETTPGPIAINCATYIGYKTGKIPGATVATISMCIPSFVIIYLVSLFFNAFLENTYVAAAFKGIQICVIFLIFCAGLKMVKKVKRTIYNLIIFAATFGCMLFLSLFAVNFSSIFYILISGTLGLLVYTVGYLRHRHREPHCNSQNDSEVDK